MKRIVLITTAILMIAACGQHGDGSSSIGMVELEGHLVIDLSFLHQAAEPALSESALQDVEVVGAQLVNRNADAELR